MRDDVFIETLVNDLEPVTQAPKKLRVIGIALGVFIGLVAVIYWNLGGYRAQFWDHPTLMALVGGLILSSLGGLIVGVSAAYPDWNGHGAYGWVLRGVVTALVVGTCLYGGLRSPSIDLFVLIRALVTCVGSGTIILWIGIIMVSRLGGMRSHVVAANLTAAASALGVVTSLQVVGGDLFGVALGASLGSLIGMWLGTSTVMDLINRLHRREIRRRSPMIR
jgi:uncharacterized membrane protein YfcA